MTRPSVRTPSTSRTTSLMPGGIVPRRGPLVLRAPNLLPDGRIDRPDLAQERTEEIQSELCGWIAQGSRRIGVGFNEKSIHPHRCAGSRQGKDVPRLSSGCGVVAARELKGMRDVEN